MAKRKFKRSQKDSSDDTESPRPLKQLKKGKNSTTEISAKNLFSSNEEHDSNMDCNNDNSLETSDIAADDSCYENFSSVMRAFSFNADSDDERQKFNETSQNTSIDCESLLNSSERKKSHNGISRASLSSHKNKSEEEINANIRVISIPHKMTEVVLLQHPASLTLHDYIKVSVWLGSITIFGYKVKEGEGVKVFSTEGTGLKEVVTLKSRHKSSITLFEKKLKKVTCNEKDIDLEDFIDNIGPSTVVLVLKKLVLPISLRFLEKYYPSAVQTRWPKSENIQKTFSLWSTEESFVIDINDDFKMISREVGKAINDRVSDDAEFGSRIIVLGDKNMGKSTLIRYLLNSSLNKHPEVFFLDTDPGQTEYTPPGVVSLYRVTQPLLDPPYAHQKKALKMIFVGSVTPATYPILYKDSVNSLVNCFMKTFPQQTLFVNTMGWNKGVGALCIQSIKDAVKPTMMIELVSPEPNICLTREVGENGAIHFKVPSRAISRESGAPSYNAKELRNFCLLSYLGQRLSPYSPVSLIHDFSVAVVCWDNIALYVMGKKVPAHRIVEAIHGSIVALCQVELSSVLKSDNPELPMTLVDEPLCECLGFGLVRSSDEANHLYHIITPLTTDELKNVNALIKGNVMVPDEVFLKQTLENVPLPFSDHSHVAKTPARKALCKRAFFRTPKKAH